MYQDVGLKTCSLHGGLSEVIQVCGSDGLGNFLSTSNAMGG